MIITYVALLNSSHLLTENLMNDFESVQGREIEMIKGLHCLVYEKMVESLICVAYQSDPFKWTC